MTRLQEQYAVVAATSSKDGSGCLGRRCIDAVDKLWQRWDSEDLIARLPELNQFEAARHEMWKSIRE